MHTPKARPNVSRRCFSGVGLRLRGRARLFGGLRLGGLLGLLRVPACFQDASRRPSGRADPRALAGVAGDHPDRGPGGGAHRGALHRALRHRASRSGRLRLGRCLRRGRGRGRHRVDLCLLPRPREALAFVAELLGGLLPFARVHEQAERARRRAVPAAGAAGGVWAAAATETIRRPAARSALCRNDSLRMIPRSPWLPALNQARAMPEAAGHQRVLRTSLDPWRRRDEHGACRSTSRPARAATSPLRIHHELARRGAPPPGDRLTRQDLQTELEYGTPAAARGSQPAALARVLLRMSASARKG